MKLLEYSLLGNAFKGGPFPPRTKVVERGAADFGSTHADRRSAPADVASTEGRRVNIESFRNSKPQIRTNFINMFG